MKKTLLIIFTSVLGASAFGQNCTPDGNYATSPPGLYPQGPLGPTCDLTAPKTIVSLTDTLLASPFGPATGYIDAMRCNSVAGLPAGLALSTDVIATADGAGPYGYWYNSGTVPNQVSAVGCAYVYGTNGDWDNAVGGGPNNDGVYPLVFTVDARIATTSNATLNAFIAAGTWVSAIPVNFGGGPLFLYDTLVVPADYANISTSISGTTNVAPATQYTYSVPADPNVTYTWTVTNGTIVGGQGTNAIIVTWTGSGMVEIDVMDGGCIGTDDLTVTANPTAIDEAAGINASIYPNPSNGIFTLQLESTEVLNIRIMDVSGKVLRSEQLAGSTLYSIDLQDAPIGVYVMEIGTAEGRSFKKLVKN